MYEFALTHYQIISLILINFLKDPYLVRHFISFLKNGDIEDARNFHISNSIMNKSNNIYLQYIKYFRKGLFRKFDLQGDISNLHLCKQVPLKFSENIMCLRLLFDDTEGGDYFRKWIPSCHPINLCISSFLRSNHSQLEEPLPSPVNMNTKPPPHITVGIDINAGLPKIIMIYI